MRGQIRNIFPGGNTSAGFYSYYRYILPQESAERIFCIKGGPGVGKSTLMKNIAGYFVKKGEDVDLFRCSSDPDSLDGILLKERKIAIVDATAPHAIDPVNPGAVDEIVDLGRFLDEKALYKQKENIIEFSRKISATFEAAYVYLKCAGIEYKHMAKLIGEIDLKETEPLFECIDKIGKKSAGNNADAKTGNVCRFFAGAITSDGIKSCISSLAENIKEIYILDVMTGCSIEKILRQASAKLRSGGFSVEEFYCPMDPGKKLEHIVSEEAGIAFFSVNDYHGTSIKSRCREEHMIKMDMPEMLKSKKEIYDELKNSSRLNIEKAIIMLRRAKALHDELEALYISAMDFEKIEGVKQEIITKIENRTSI